MEDKQLDFLKSLVENEIEADTSHRLYWGPKRY